LVRTGGHYCTQLALSQADTIVLARLIAVPDAAGGAGEPLRATTGAKLGAALGAGLAAP
jgi:hypothetical protein